MGHQIRVIDISKEDVVNMNYSLIQKDIQEAESTIQILETEKMSWEITFNDYISDPRPLSDIPEVVAWINGSVDAGIPWFFFLRTGFRPQSLLLLLACGAKSTYTDAKGAYLTDVNKFREFVSINFFNLSSFLKKNGYSDRARLDLTDTVMRVVKEMIV